MDGSVEVYSCPVVAKLWIVVCQPAPIMSMAFHPQHVDSDEQGEEAGEKAVPKFSSLLAFGSNKSRVYVVDCPVLAGDDCSQDADGVVARTIGQVMMKNSK
jgi:hypothetical protein